MKNLMGRALSTYGRRGTVLLVLGVIWLAQGVLVLGVFERDAYLLLSGPEWLKVARATGWFATGVYAIWSAHRPQGKDAGGFLALYVMIGYRFVAYMFGFLDWFWTTSGRDGDPRGIVSALVYAAQAFLIYLIAGWREPEIDPRKDRHR